MDFVCQNNRNQMLVRPFPKPKPYPGVAAWKISYTDESTAKKTPTTTTKK